MSRFFRRTNTTTQPLQPATESAVLDLEQTVAAVKEKVAKQIGVNAIPDVARARMTVEPTGTEDVKPDLPLAAPLGLARTIALPHLDPMLLLATRTDPNPVAIEAFERLRNRLLRFQAKMNTHSLVICGADAGEGKTMVAANLALSCAQVHKSRVLLVDADLRSHGLSDLLGGVPAPGLSDVLAGTASYESALVGADVPHLALIGAGTSYPPSAQLFASPRWKEFIQWSSDNFDLVLVDSPPILRVADFDLIAAGCGGILMVVRERHTTRDVLEKALGLLDHSKLAGVVYNASEEIEKRSYYARYYHQYGQAAANRTKH